MYLARNWKAVLTVCLVFCLSAGPVIGKSIDSTKTYSLGEVVVSGKSVGTEATTTIEIDSEDIEQKNIHTLDKALELLPGVDVSKGTAGIPRVNVRGFRSRHTILLVNGIPFNSTWDQQFDPHLIPVENISKIKISYGTHSALYGQGGLAGVINIITKQGTEGFGMNGSAQIDERGCHVSKISASGGTESIDFFTSLSQSHATGFRMSDNFDATGNEDGGMRENSDDKRLSFFGNLGFKVNEDLDLGVTVDHSSGEFGVPPNTISDNTDPFYKKAKYERVEDFENVSAQFSFGYHPDGMFGLRGWAFVNSQKQEYASYDDSFYYDMRRRNSYRDDTEITIKGVTFQPVFDFDKAGELILGLSGQQDEYSSDLDKVLANNNPPTHFDYDYDTSLYSLALEYRVNPFQGLDLVAGAGYFWHQKDIGSDDDKASYMIGASYALTDTTVVRASYAAKVRFPSIRQLYDATSGDSSLKPEESDNYEIGISQTLFSDLQIDVSAFLSDIENYIEKDDNTNLFENNQEYRFKGFDIRISKSFLKTGRIALSYSYLETEDKSSNTQKDELQYRPEHKFVVDAGYTFDFGLTVNADLIYIGEQSYYNDTYQKGKLSDYTIVNLRLEQQVYKDYVSLFLGADNLLDENYEESYGFPQPGRTAYAGIRLKF